MKRALVVFLITIIGCSITFAQRFTDNLGRGLVAVPVGAAGNSTANLVSWRRLADEYYGVSYNLYKNGSKIASNLTTTCYNDGSSAPTSTKYKVAAVVNGVEQTPCDEVKAWGNGNAYKLDDNHRYPYGYLDIDLATVYDRDGNDVTSHYQPNDAEVADLDGDGELEIIIKRLNTTDATGINTGEIDAKGNAIYNIYPQSSKEFVVLDAYDVDWNSGDASLMWRIDCGPNMVSSNSTEINIIAYDWDEDGKAEVVLRGADNMIIYGSDGLTQLHTIGDMSANTRQYWLSSRKSDGTATGSMAYTNTGNEYLLYMNGQTGTLYKTTDNKDYMDYPLKRLEEGETDLNAAWGDGYGHRSSKYFFGAPFLDGRTASLFLARGIYTRHKMMAMDLTPKTHTWSTRWTWNCSDSSSPWYGNGYHNFIIADVDEDGRDEIVYGSMVIDDNGKGLSTTGLGHGDAQHVSDFDPYRPGLEFFGCNEDKPAMNYRNATTSEIYYRQTASDDDGRALMGNFSSTIPGCLGRSVSTGLISSVKDAVVADGPTGTNDGLFWSHLNFRIYWDDDLGDEILDSPGTESAPAIWDHEDGRIFVPKENEGVSMNNSSKNNACFQGDIIGDWREEIIVRRGTNIRVYATGLGTSHSLPSLWFDHQYRQAMVWQMMAYNQPPHLSYFLGELEGITQAPPPLTNRGRTEIASDGTISTSLNGQHVLICDNTQTASSFTIAEGAQPAIITVNTPIWVQGNDNNSNIVTKNDYKHTLTGAALTGSTRLTKQGGGTLKLNSTTHTFTGNTDVWGGTLEFNGTLQYSPLWLNRFTTLRSTGGTFGGGITADYGSTIIPGGENTKGTITTTTLTLNHGARLLLDVYPDMTADKVNASSLTVNTKTGNNWVNYGPQYLKPVIEMVAHGTLPDGTYDLGTVDALSGDVNDIVLEGVSGATLSLCDGHLCLVIGEGTATFCAEPVITETVLQTTSEGIKLPVVSITPTPFGYNSLTVTPSLSATFTNLQGVGSEANIVKTFYREDYKSSTTVTGWTSPGANMSIATGDATYGNYFFVNTDNTNTRYAYQLLTGVDVSTVTSYAIEFDLAVRSGNTDPVEFCVMSKNGVMPSNNWDNYAYINGNANMLFDITAPKQSTTFTVNGTTTTTTTTTLTSDTWYHYKLQVNRSARTVDWSISNGSSGTFSLPDGTSADVDGFYLVAGRYYSLFRLDNINIYATDRYEYAFSKPGTLTVTSSYEGCASVNTDYEAGFVGVMIGGGGWATLGCRYPLVLSSDELTAAGLTAVYTATKKDDATVMLTPVTSVPAETGLLLRGAAGDYRLPIADSPELLGENLLYAVTATDGYTVSSTDNIYVLANKAETGVGFYLCNQGVNIPAGKAYLVMPTGARSFIGFDEQDTEDIVEMRNEKGEMRNDSAWYTLDGRHVGADASPLKKGIYINNHKKIIVK